MALFKKLFSFYFFFCWAPHPVHFLISSSAWVCCLFLYNSGMDYVACVHFLRVLKLNSIVFQRLSGNWIPCAVKSEHTILSCSKCLSVCPCPQRAEGNIPSCFGSVGSGIFLCSLNRQHAWNNSGWHLEVAFFKKPFKKNPFWLDLRGKSWQQASSLTGQNET